MSNSADEPSKIDRAKVALADSNWPLTRKVETLIFLGMFLAVPLFAIRVIEYTRAELTIRNICRELVVDLGRAKIMAIQTKQNVEVTATAMPRSKFFSYVMMTPKGIREEIVMPETVSVSGMVTFTESGLPQRPSSFIVSSFSRNSTVEIDKAGVVSVP